MKLRAKCSLHVLVLAASAILASTDGFAQSDGASAKPLPDGFPAWAFLWDPNVKVPVPDDTPNRLPGSDAAFSWKQARDLFVAPDWHPNDHPAMPDIVAH